MGSTFTTATLTLTLLLLTIHKSLGAVGPISESGSMFPQFSETFDPSIWEEEMEDTREGPSARFRLPNQIVPKHYNLRIRPILIGDPEVDPFTAPGSVQITVECRQATNELVMHAAELDINLTSVRVWQGNQPDLTIVNQTFDTDEMVQSYTIRVQQSLVAGQRYEIYIEYVAKVAHPIKERMNGIYWSSYMPVTGDRRYLATTQFSRTRGFRKMLPSFDEPSQKATFEITVGRQDGFHSLSNMNLIGSDPIPELPGWQWDRFNTTPIMSPTIIAIIVSDFESETAPPHLFHPDKPVKVWGPPPEMMDGGGVFAAESAAVTLKYFQDYFGIEYELPKIDSAAIPDFAAGAMENWGLNTYRVMYLIWKEGVNTVAEKFRIANILGHELAHQYWGNFVTHAWWNDWWLTEGFASYYEYRSVDSFHPDFEAIERVVTSDVQPAMEFDSGPNSVPIHGSNSTHFVENPSQINYAKGAALVNMMRSFMTEEVFKQACSFYLMNRAYSAVDQDALFADLNTYLSTNGLMPSNNKTIKQIMDTWTLQTSFPLVKVSRAGANHIFISQERFENIEVRESQKDPKENGLWHVPIFYTSAANPEFDSDNNLPKFWIDNEVLLMMHAIDTSQWLLVNPGGNGYYRVIYDAHFENLLKTQLAANISSIPVGSRSMIVDDYFAAAYQAYIPMNRAFNMMDFISQETNFNVWVPYLKHLRKGYELFSNNDIDFGHFKTHIEQRMQTALDAVGLEQIPSEPSMNTILRVQLFDWLCPMFHTDCVNEANRLFVLWRATPTVNPIPVDLRPSLYCAATSDASNGNWDFLMTQYDMTRDSLVRNGLACTPSATQITAIHTKILTDNTIPSADVRGFLERLAANSVARPGVLSQLSSQFPSLILPAKLGDTGVAGVISSLATYTSDLAIRDELQTLVTDNADELLDRDVMLSINASLARIGSNKQWFDNFGRSILQWVSLP